LVAAFFWLSIFSISSSAFLNKPGVSLQTLCNHQQHQDSFKRFRDSVFQTDDCPFRRRRRRRAAVACLMSSNSLPSGKNSPLRSKQEKVDQPTQFKELKKVDLQKTLTSLVLASFVLFVPIQEAQAGFGPSGGATTSPTAGVNKVNLQNLSEKKLGQLIDSTIDGSRLDDLKSQLDALIDNISDTLDKSSTDEEEEAVKTSQTESKKLEQARSFEAQILKRNQLLERLEAQPEWFNYFAAFCGSLTSTLMMHPVDTLKTRLQATKSSSNDDEEEQEERKLFSNLYEGLAGNILKEGPPSALYLGVYQTIKSNLLNGKLSAYWTSLMGASGTGMAQATSLADPSYLLSVYLIAGAVGELIGSVVRAPAEAIKSTVQTQAAASTAEAFEKVVLRPEGRSNIVRAWSSSALRDIPFGAIQIALFELIKAYILNSPDIDFDSSTLQSEAIIGACSGSVGAFLTNPMDVVTTRIITQEQSDENQEPVGFFQMIPRVYNEGGLSAFFAGWQARVLYWGPAISIFLTCYCTVRQLGIKFDLFM
jgi:solute carrier family 25 (mitochondrial S-adenosylmethionine transporter), member 26